MADIGGFWLELHRQKIAQARAEREAESAKVLNDLRKAQLKAIEMENSRKQETMQALMRGRSEAGAALSLLTETPEQRGFSLDPQARGELQGIVTRQQAQEGDFQPIQKLLQMRDDMGRRRELAQSLDPLLEDLPSGQQVLGRFALRAYTGGQLDDSRLFQFFDRMSGSQGPTSMLSLAFMAAGKGPRSAQARRALELLPEEQHNMTTTQLLWLSQQGGEMGQKAQAALDALTKLRQTGVRSRKRSRRTEEEPPSPFLQPRLNPLPGGGVQGTGRPKVKSFRRVK